MNDESKDKNPNDIKPIDVAELKNLMDEVFNSLKEFSKNCEELLNNNK